MYRLSKVVTLFNVLCCVLSSVTSKSWRMCHILSSFNFVEIAFIRFVCKQCFHTLTYSQFSTLIVHLYFPSSLSLCTFLKKVPKTWAAVSGIRCFLCSRVALRHLSVGSPLAARCLSQCLGRQELASLKHHAAFSNHCSATRCASQRCPSAVGGELPLRRRFIDVPYAL